MSQTSAEVPAEMPVLREQLDRDAAARSVRATKWRVARLAIVVVVAVGGLALIGLARPDDPRVDIVRLELAGSTEDARAAIDDALADSGVPAEPGAVLDRIELIRSHLDSDDTFVVVYVLCLVVPLLLLVGLRFWASPRFEGTGRLRHAPWPSRVGRARAWHSWYIAGTVAAVAVVGAGVLDRIENHQLRRGLASLRDRASEGDDALVGASGPDGPWGLASFVAGTKFALLAFALVVLVAMASTWISSMFAPALCRPATKLPPEVAASWKHEHGTTPKVGISCSGGGVRSATFCLGALQVLDDEEVLSRASYVTAVSGGGYMAASWAIANRMTDPALLAPTPTSPEPPAPVFAPRSPEEQWVRLHSAHLVSSSLVFLAGMLRLISGILFGWLLIWLLMFAVTRPVGWVISSSAAHPELRARTPILESVTQPELVGAPVVRFVEENASADPPYSLYAFTPSYSCAVLRSWADTTADSSTRAEVGLVTTGEGVVRVERGEASITAQPTMETVGETPPVEGTRAADDDQGCGPNPNELPPAPNADGPAVVVSTDPAFELDARVFATTPRAVGGETSASIAAAIQSSLRETTSPTVTHRSGMTGRTSITIGPGQWLTALALITVGFAFYLARVLWRPFNARVRRTLEQTAAMASLVGAAWLLVFVVLPWCVQEIPPFLGELLHVRGDAGGASGDGATGLDAVLAALGITGLLAAAVRAFGQLAIKQGKAHLSLVTKLAVGVLLPLVGALVFLDLLEFATANGPRGEMLGLGIGMTLDGLPGWITSDVARWVGVLLVLGLLAFVDAHSWSMFPFYKRRLSQAYVIRRSTRDKAEAVPFEEGPILIAKAPTLNLLPPSLRHVLGVDRAKENDLRELAAGWVVDPPPPPARTASGAEPPVDSGSVGADEKEHIGPQLVMCCAANVSNCDVAPPGRRSVSFTVSNEMIGSDELGWMPTTKYFERLGKRRLSDVTLPSLMAISGAAVSPGMGKMSRGPIDSLLALLNVRLGVWLPSPAAVNERDHKGPWRKRPGWTWYLREVVGWFPTNASYVYVSDGGHWENLGLVELFRRGCTEIYCVSAAGDGPESFSTIGEAIALAREQFGIEFDIDLSALRRPAKTPDSVRRPLRRRPKKTTDATIADADWASGGHVAGRFWYPDDPKGDGHPIVILEANLADDIPWDVQTWAESNQAFPDDPTTDQLFSHRQFESYRALGRCQMKHALHPTTVDQSNAGTPAEPSPTREPPQTPDQAGSADHAERVGADSAPDRNRRVWRLGGRDLLGRVVIITTDADDSPDQPSGR